MSESEEKVTIAVMNTKLEALTAKVDIIGTKLDNHYVTKEEFWAVKTLVYGFAGLVLMAAVGALINLVVKQ